MNFRSLLPASSLLVLASLMAPATVQAEAVNVTVTALVSDGCVFDSLQAGSTLTMSLGLIRPTSNSAVIAPQRSLLYRCTAGSSYRVSFTSATGTVDITGNGSSERIMRSDGGGSFPKNLSGSGTTTSSTSSAGLPYTLAWTVPAQFTGEGVEPGTPTHEVSLTASVAAGAAAGLPPGLYSDTVTVTISSQ